MKAGLAKRIADLEQRRGDQSRRMHIVQANDQADLDRQMARLLESGAVRPQNGFLCLTGRP